MAKDFCGSLLTGGDHVAHFMSLGYKSGSISAGQTANPVKECNRLASRMLHVVGHAWELQKPMLVISVPGREEAIEIKNVRLLTETILPVCVFVGVGCG